MRSKFQSRLVRMLGYLQTRQSEFSATPKGHRRAFQECLFGICLSSQVHASKRHPTLQNGRTQAFVGLFDEHLGTPKKKLNVWIPHCEQVIFEDVTSLDPDQNAEPHPSFLCRGPVGRAFTGWRLMCGETCVPSSSMRPHQAAQAWPGIGFYGSRLAAVAVGWIRG